MNARLAPGPPEAPAVSVLEALRGPTFELLGGLFLVVPEHIWLTLEFTGPAGRDLRRRACGRICLGGVRHIIVDRAADVDPSGQSVAEVLTRRELEIALQIARGAGNKDIARRLGISHFTVREHVRRICHKLRVHSRAAIAAAVGDSGW